MTASAADVARVVVRGEELHLLPERAAYRPATRTLLVADAHFGKAAAFRAGGIPVPGGTTADALARLDGALARTGARRVVFLGDFLHARTGRAPATIDALARWRAGRTRPELVLVRGNHDRNAGDPPDALGIASVDPPLLEAPFVLAHHPGTSADGYVLAGHLHPGASLLGPARERERLPCFWFCPHGAVLPAFGDFTGLATVTPATGDRVFVVADHEVIQVRG